MCWYSIIAAETELRFLEIQSTFKTPNYVHINHTHTRTHTHTHTHTQTESTRENKINQGETTKTPTTLNQ